MTILGQFDFANYATINAFDEHWNGLESTLLHEIVHLQLTKTTAYGFLSTLVDRIKKFNPPIAHLDKFTIEHMLKLQEGVCTFSEIVLFAENNTFEDLLGYLKTLRNENKKYYNYMEPNLTKFIKFMNKSNNALYVEPIELFHLIRMLAYASLNCALTSIPIEVMNSKTRLRKYLSRNDPRLFIPNSRFQFLLKRLYHELNLRRGGALCVEAIIGSVLKGLPDGELLTSINFDHEKKTVFFEQCISNTKCYIKNLCSDAKYKKEIYESINLFALKSIESTKLPHHVVPHNFKQPRHSQRVESQKIIEAIHDNDSGIYFILLDNTIQQTVNKKIVYIPKEFFLEINKLYPVHVLLSYMSHSNGHISSFFPMNKLHLIFEQGKKPIVINYKLKQFIQGLPHSLTEKVFIYCDRPYSTASETINEFAMQTKRAFFLEYGNMTVLIVRLANNKEFFLPFVSSLLPDVIRDIKDGILNLSLCEDNPTDTQVYDLIIGCLYECNNPSY